MRKEAMGRLILEASTGMHGDAAKQLADAWAVQAHEAQLASEALQNVHDYVRGKDSMYANGALRQFCEEGLGIREPR